MSTTSTQAIRYRWDELPSDHPREKITRRRIIGENVMISHVALKKGFTVPTHAHANEQMAMVMSGKVCFGIGESGNDQTHETLEAGEVLHLPANVPHSAKALENSIVIDVFSPPSETTGVDEG